MMELIIKNKKEDFIKFFEFNRKNWTFHAKGLKKLKIIIF
jgi:hypothetical protein